jgi:ABC-type cobalamin/Fe3+-siderophores transport system ATPase subunit
MAVRYADDILVLDRGKLRFAGTVESCLETGILEDHFKLKRYSIEENGEKRIFFSGE